MTNSSLCKIVMHPAQAGAIALFFLACGRHTHAQTVMVSNLTEVNDGDAPVSYVPAVFIFPSQHFSEAQSFITGSSETVLDDITLSIFTGSGTGFSLALYSDSAGQPGALLETLSGSPAPTATGNYSYTSSGALTLSASTAYWWVASVPSGGAAIDFRLNSTSSTAETSSAGWTIGDTSLQQQNGGAWIQSGQPFQFSASATAAIPEPGACAALVGAAALVFAAYHRRRA